MLKKKIKKVELTVLEYFVCQILVEYSIGSCFFFRYTNIKIDFQIFGFQKFEIKICQEDYINTVNSNFLSNNFVFDYF